MKGTTSNISRVYSLTFKGLYSFLGLLFFWQNSFVFGMYDENSQRPGVGASSSHVRVDRDQEHAVQLILPDVVETGNLDPTAEDFTRQQQAIIQHDRAEISTLSTYEGRSFPSDLTDDALTEDDDTSFVSFPKSLLSNKKRDDDVLKLLGILKAKNEIPHFSIALLNSIRVEVEKYLTYYGEFLRSIQQDRRFDTHINFPNLPNLYDDYEKKLRSIIEERQKLEANLQTVQELQSKCFAKIQKLLSEPIAQEYTWSESSRGIGKTYFHYKNDVPFVGWEEKLSVGTRRKRIVNAQSPELQIEYRSSGRCGCSGTVTIFVAPKDDLNTRILIDLLQENMRERETMITQLKEQISICDKKQEHEPIDEIFQQSLDYFNGQLKRLQKVLDIRSHVDQLYEQQQKRFEEITKSVDECQADEPLLQEIAKEYKKICAMTDQEELGPEFLLDPVYLSCADDRHGKIYEHYKIAAELCAKQWACSKCGKRTRLVPLGLQDSRMNTLIIEVFDCAIKTKEFLEEILSSI